MTTNRTICIIPTEAEVRALHPRARVLEATGPLVALVADGKYLGIAYAFNPASQPLVEPDIV